MLDFIRIACAVPEVKVGDVRKNTAEICRYVEKADYQRADILLLPELAMTGYSCADLFHQTALWNAVRDGLGEIVDCSQKHPAVNIVVGLPVRLNGKLLNCAAMICAGKIRGIVPKSYLWGSEGRWFVSGDDLKETAAGLDVFGDGKFGFISLGTQLLFDIGEGAVVGIEICEDLNAPVSPAAFMALNGANVILNLSASPELSGKRTDRRERVVAASKAGRVIYAYVSAGATESTSDMVYSGHSLIAENGRILKENEAVADSAYMIVQDCDLGRITAARQKDASFQKAAAQFGSREYLIEPMRGCGELRSDGTLYPLSRLPYVPSGMERDQICMDIFQIQVAGLKQRLKTLGANAVIGISGGLDSTLAMLVCVEAMRQLSRPLADIHGVTMPCFGTSARTHSNSWELMRTLGITGKEISVEKAVMQHFEDIGHDAGVHNGTYENAQARERTQVLMDYASVVGGIVVGTGDLSELALGWCTYNGDHMSMYSVNSNIPKTLIPWIIRTVGEMPDFRVSKEVLEDILNTPISPELLPPDAEGKISQHTEDLVGPYALHDFFLYHHLEFGFAPAKIYTLACRAFQGAYEPEEIKKWLRSFYRRFFSQQFKRNCMPDGVKVLQVGLSPRGDWMMPSEAAASLWLEEVDKL